MNRTEQLKQLGALKVEVQRWQKEMRLQKRNLGYLPTQVRTNALEALGRFAIALRWALEGEPNPQSNPDNLTRKALEFLAKEKLHLARKGTIHTMEGPQEADRSEEIARHYRVGEMVTCSVAAPGIGQNTYMVTRIDEGGVWAVLIESNVRELTIADVI